MHIKEITDAQQWNSFLLKLQPNTFLHSWEWGEIQRQSGERARYLGCFDAQRQIGAALVITVSARRGRHLFIPHGPIFSTEEETRRYLPDIISYCKAITRKERAVAIRVAPLLITSPENNSVFASLGFRPAPLHVHTELTWMLDIAKPQEALLAQMRKTTRQAIKKAQQSGASITIVTGDKALNRFFPLYKATKYRHGFVPFSQEFLQRQAAVFAPEHRIYFCFAQHEGRDVAAGIFLQFGNTVFYHHGASIKLLSSVSASQLLQWESICEAQRRGAVRYNFWGIAPDQQPLHPFAGITIFKKGFGGYAVDYLHAQDLPCSLGYWKLWIVETARKYHRGFE